ncbi:hypothetical protein RJ639_022493 [Escallonia herrerae]|uniref:NAF domain-containing protein n=1 Tax=Escallonia herrerae TaxID=1293975 RepID=A0AA89AHX4_9ASTE|nr:hypothetical protein RJ639_022493 [Escallonia herrerae]
MVNIQKDVCRNDYDMLSEKKVWPCLSTIVIRCRGQNTAMATTTTSINLEGVPQQTKAQERRFTFDQLMQHLHIEEKTRNRENESAKETIVKAHVVVDKDEKKNSGRHNQNKFLKPKNSYGFKRISSNPNAKNKECYNCHKIDLGEADVILGIKIIRSQHGIVDRKGLVTKSAQFDLSPLFEENKRVDLSPLFKENEREEKKEMRFVMARPTSYVISKLEEVAKAVKFGVRLQGLENGGRGNWAD